MAARKERKTHCVEQREKVVPFITGEVAFGRQVSYLVLGVNIFDLDVWVHVDCVRKPIKRDSMGSGHVSPLKNITHGFEVRRFIILSVTMFLRFGVDVGVLALTLISRLVSQCWKR